MIAARDPARHAGWAALGQHCGRTITQELGRAVAETPGVRLHFWSDAGVQSCVLTEIAESAARVAGGLAALGLKSGDVIASQIPHARANLVVFFAAMRLGLIYVPIVGIYGPAELSFILRQSGARLIAAPSRWRGTDFAARFEAIEAAPALRWRLSVDAHPLGADQPRLEDLAADEPVAALQTEPHAPAIIIYTSGSTGVSKGAVHTHETALAELRGAADFIADCAPKTVLSPLPTGHVAGIMAMLRPIVHGIDAVYMDHWSAEAAADLIAQFNVGWSYGTPFHLSGLLDVIAHRPLPSLTAYQIGGAGVPRALIERADTAGIRACRGYGCTEQPTITSNRPSDPLEKRAGSDGRPMPGVSVRIVDEAGEDVAPGGGGEVLSIGPDQFQGYLDPHLNGAAFDAQGWFRTGDLGVFDAQGYLAIVGRKKEIIIRGGENIAPAEVEDILMRDPRVVEAAVIAKPDPVYGERVAAVLRLRDGTRLVLADVKAHFASQGVAVQKTPEHLEIVNDFPRTPMGKIHKGKLKDLMFGAPREEQPRS